MVAKIGRGRNGKGSKCPATTISAHRKVGKIVYIKILSKSLAQTCLFHKYENVSLYSIA